MHWTLRDGQFILTRANKEPLSPSELRKLLLSASNDELELLLISAQALADEADRLGKAVLREQLQRASQGVKR